MTCGLDGWALSTVTSGASPFTSYRELIVQVGSVILCIDDVMMMMLMVEVIMIMEIIV